MTGHAQHQLVLENCVNPECLDRIHEALERLWADAGDVAELDRMMFEIAVIEVAGNVVRHGGSRQGFDCQITIRVFDGSLEARFVDTGDAAEIDIPGAGLPDDMAEAGRGLAMARQAVHELTYERVDGVNCWRVTRDRTG